MLNHLSETLLLQVKKQENSEALQKELAELAYPSLVGLENDTQKKAFWINIYNAYYQLLRKDGFNKPKVYTERAIKIARQDFSLDDIEHGILRKNHHKYSLGFFKKLFARNVLKELAVDRLDYRIHFALNCGAKSCPPIAFYNEEKLDQQLDLATQVFLEGESEYEESKQVLHTTTLFKWFLADFGGISGIKKIYLDQLGKDISAYKIKFKKYNWEDELSNFVD